ncbi:MAG: cyanobacterial porin [Cyanobacteria bacterium RYN_339]|nr:cyanobacterial porin [Cyanobacteria bacterium RYN_339]
MSLLRTAGLAGAAALTLAVGLVALPAPAVAAPQVSQMQDLPPDHWAYKAIQQLVEKYGVMEGFPDSTFRGTKTVSRYELAAALTKVMLRMDAVAAARPAGAPTAPAPKSVPQVTPQDTASVDKLKTEFKTELDAIAGRLDKDEASIKEIQDKLAKLVTVSGRVSTVYADETLDTGKDRTLPYIASNLSVTFKGKVSDSTTFDTTIGGALKAGGSGDVPAVMAGALGKTPTTDQVSVKGARFTSKIGATTINVGRFRLDAVDFGPYSDLAWRTGDFDVGVGAVSQDASSLRVGGDVGASLGTEIGPVKVLGGLNSNIVAGQVNLGLGPVTLKAGYETDHKAITQNLLNAAAAPVKTTDNAAVVLEIGGEGALGATAQVNATNFALTAYGLGLRASGNGIDGNLVAMINSDPGKTVTVASFGAVVGTPQVPLPWNLKIPALLLAFTDNYTIDAPARADGKATTGAGGQALGKLAGVSLRADLDNPLIPGLVAEYNVQAKLIEDVFLPNAADPITSESLFFKSVIKF